MKKAHILVLPLLISLVFSHQLIAQNKITTPKEALGFDVGEDYFLASYTQLSDYWKKLAQESDRLYLLEIGKTAEGRQMYMAVITSPENHNQIIDLTKIRLSRATGLLYRPLESESFYKKPKHKPLLGHIVTQLALLRLL